MGRFSDIEVERLKGAAWAVIEHGAERGGQLLSVKAADYPEALRESRASFVTLREGGSLRGCMGSLEARMPLVEEVARNAHNAAFKDPRFSPVSSGEIPRLKLKLSVLTVPEPFPVESEEDLLNRIQPGIDGLVLKDGGRRATFLPAVWEALPSPREFIRQLKRKAGLSEDHWSDRIAFLRYRADEY